MLRRALTCLFAVLVYGFTVFGPALDMARASQNSLFSPATGTVTGLQLTNNYNSALDSVNTCNSGASAPTNQLSGVPSLGNCWIDTATTPNTLNYYDGADWLPEAYLDTTNHIWIPNLGGGNGTPTIASATTTNLCPSTVGASVAPTVEVTGTTTITGFGTNCGNGVIKIVEFGGALTLTNSGSLVLLGAGNITTAAGDWGIFIYVSGTGWYNVAYQKANGSALTSVGLNIGASALANSALSFTVPTNLQLNAAVASNELTVSVCTINSGSNTCNNASSSNPILFAFRDPTAANGDPTIVSLQASLGFTTGATSDSFGCTTAVLCRLWVWAIDNAGTIDLCVYNADNPTGPSVVDLNEGAVQTSQSGTGGGTSVQALYCNASAVSSKAVRRLGYIEATWTSGTGWSGPTTVQLFGPGVKKPCDVVQTIYAQSSTAATATIVPTSAVNLVQVNATVVFSAAGNANAAAQIKRGATAVGQPTYAYYASGVSVTVVSSGAMAVLDNPATTSSTSYTISNGGAVSIGSETLSASEIMGALDKPSNDNGSRELRMIG